MLSVTLPERHTLNADMLRSAFHIVDDPTQADYGIAWKTDRTGLPPERVVMCQSEPPVKPAIRRSYVQFSKYHTVLRFSPDPAAPNEFAFSDRPHLYPYRPPEGAIRTWFRDEPAEGEGIFFAGQRQKDLSLTPQGPVLYGLRSRVAAFLRNEFGGYCFGEGWADNPKHHTQGWPGYAHQLKEIVRYDPAYVLAFENFRLPGYITEKFWSGILSYRPTIYYGAPDISEHVDPAAFIDISPAIEEISFDPSTLVDIVMCINRNRQREAVRSLVASIGNEPDEERDRCTAFIINRIEGRA